MLNENQNLLNKLQTEAGRGELIKNCRKFIGDTANELSFSFRIIPITKIDTTDARVTSSPDCDSLIYTDPETGVSSPFMKILSRLNEVSHDQLLASRWPITKALEDGPIRDLSTLADAQFLRLAEEIVVNPLVCGDNLKMAIRMGCDVIHGSRMMPSSILMSKHVFNDIYKLGQEGLGEKLYNEVKVNGYTYATFFGHKLVVTMKSEMLTKNPYNPKAGVSFLKKNEATSYPYDASYKIGTNIAGCQINGDRANGLYPKYDLLINGEFTPGVSEEGWRSSDSAKEPASTKNWMGNTLYFFTEPKFLGFNVDLGDIDFMIQQDMSTIRYQASKRSAMKLITPGSVSMVILK